MRYYRYNESLGYGLVGITVEDLPYDGAPEVVNLPSGPEVLDPLPGMGLVEMFDQDWPRASSWTPLAITEVDDAEEDGTKLEPGDFPGLSNFCRIPVFSARAWEVLSRRIDCRWEALPLTPPAWTQLYLIHVMETIDCVDLDRSEFYRRPSGCVGRIERFCLKPEMLEGKHIFKTPYQSGGDLLVDDVFREIVQQNGLKGLVFRQGLLPMVASADEAETFSDAGEARYTQLAGRPIRTANDLAAALQDGTILPGQVPVNYVLHHGQKVLLKGLNWTALTRAGVAESDWVQLDQTGNAVPGMYGTTFDDMARIHAQREDVPNKAGKRGNGPTRRR